MDAELLLSLAALAISLLAALYARWAAIEAKKANRLSQIEKRIEIYRAFDSLRFAMLRKACGITHEETSALYQAARESEFHFPHSISEKLKKYHHVCFELAEVNRKINRSNLKEEEITAFRKQQDELLNEEMILAKNLEKILREELKSND